jgi:hypothetical protein
MTDSDTRVFPTRVDSWLLLLVVGGLGAAFVASAFEAARGSAEGWVSLVVLILVTAPVVGASVPTRYCIGPDILTIRSGFIRIAIPLSSIREVRRTRNPLSAPAWSLDRLRVEHGRTGVALISPVRQAEFLALLEVRASLRRSGDKLVRD